MIGGGGVTEDAGLGVESERGGGREKDEGTLKDNNNNNNEEEEEVGVKGGCVYVCGIGMQERRESSS